jgi:hypothetical protein
MRTVVVSEYVTLDGVFENLDRWHFDFWHDERSTSWTNSWRAMDS